MSKNAVPTSERITVPDPNWRPTDELEDGGIFFNHHENPNFVLDFIREARWDVVKRAINTKVKSIITKQGVKI